MNMEKNTQSLTLIPTLNSSLTSAYVLKACVRYFHQIFIFSPNHSPSKPMKNAFYFI